MDKVDSLIKILAEFKEELNKNINSSYVSTSQTMAKDAPDASAAAPPVNGVPDMAKEEPHKDDPHHEAKEKKIASKVKAEAQDLLDMHKEELMCSANGQWNIKGAKY